MSDYITDLLARLRAHAGPAVVGCTRRSDVPNCPACDCGHAADEIERLLADNRNMEAARDTIERLTKDNSHMAERAQADFVELKELRAKLEGLHQGDL